MTEQMLDYYSITKDEATTIVQAYFGDVKAIEESAPIISEIAEWLNHIEHGDKDVLNYWS